MSFTNRENNVPNYELTPEERAYIDGSIDPRTADLCFYYALAVNRLEHQWITQRLANDAVYGSQSVRQDLNGADEIVPYIVGKFETLKRLGEEHLAGAELGYMPGIENPCVIVYQRESLSSSSELGRRLMLMTIEVDTEGKARNFFCVTVVPEPSSAQKALASSLVFQ